MSTATSGGDPPGRGGLQRRCQVKAYCDARESYYRRLAEQKPKLAVFLKGWLNRLNALRNEVGLRGFEAAIPLDFGDAGYIAKIPDVGEDRDYDL